MSETEKPTGRREFLNLLAISLGGAGAVALAVPLVSSLQPSADVRAGATVKVDIGALEVGQALTVQWRGKPVFIRRRNPEEILQAQDVALDSLPDPQADDERVINNEYLVLIGVCTHLGCIPLGQKSGTAKGDFGGWFCPCHGSHYDTSGRIRKGPAPNNLAVPEYSFISDNIIQIG